MKGNRVMRKALATVGIVLATSAGAFALGHVTDKPTVQVDNSFTHQTQTCQVDRTGTMWCDGEDSGKLQDHVGSGIRDIRTDEPVACGLSEDSYLVDCRTGERLDYRGNGWWPTGDYANR